MSLQKLDVFRVRNIQEISILPCSKLNFIFGKNASGKSSLLDAIYILGRAKSFRSTSIKHVINFENEDLVVHGKLINHYGSLSQLGVQMDGKHVEIRIAGESNQARSDLAYALPVQLIHPKSYRLLDAGPQLRREFMDWGIFNENKEFLAIWRNFKRSLDQRNALLKKQLVDDIDVWDQEIDRYGTVVADYRQMYLQKLLPYFNEIANLFMHFEKLKFNIICGWDKSRELKKVLKDDLNKDLRYGYTHNGPHRGDFQLLLDERSAKDYVSRGELKLLVIALKLAQVKLMDKNENFSACVLIDDIAAELDLSNRKILINYLSEMNLQSFMTANEKQDFGDISTLNDYHMFHMEQGNVMQM